MVPRSALSAVLIIATFASASAAAHGVRFGFHFGFPVVYPPAWYYAPPAYPYHPPVVVLPAPAYVERSDAAAPESHWWYYCPDSKTYYPYARECASTWQRVPPRPPSS